MDWNENLEDTSIDDIFNFNTNTQGEKKKKRSSILKQTKKATVDIYENEETATDYRRNRPSMKRVSFAETFQVKELHTGNIYDIPGLNESGQRSQASFQLSYATESETNNFGGNFPSRSFIPETSTVTSQEPTENYMKQTTQDDMDLCYSDRNDSIFVHPSMSVKSNLETQSEKKIPPSSTSQAVRALLEDKSVIEDEEVTHARDNASVYETYSRKEEHPKDIFDDFDFLGESLFKGSSQENSNKLPFDINPENIVWGKISQKSAKSFQEVDVLKKENLHETSPKFKNLKFIDSPPSWKSSEENVLKRQNKALAGNQEEEFITCVALKNKNKFTKSEENQRNSPPHLSSEEDKENIYLGTVQKTAYKAAAFKLLPDVPFSSSGGEDKNLDLNNKTRHNVSAMELTLLPEVFNEDVEEDFHSPKPDIPVDLELSLGDLPLNRYAGNVIGEGEFVNKKTLNKTRLSTYDMDMTCAVNYSMNESLLSISPLCEEKLGTIGELGFVASMENDKLNGFKVAEIGESPKSSQQSNPNFSFEEIEQIPPTDSIGLVDPQPANDVDKLSNSPMLKSDCENASMNRLLGNKNHCFNAHITSSGSAGDVTLKKMELNLNLVPTSDVASGRKFLKFSADLENSSDRLQTQSPEKTESSFTLRNKENLHSNRKRIIHSTHKPTRMPLGFRTEESVVASQSRSSGKCLSEMTDTSKADSIPSEGSALFKERVAVDGPWEPEIPATRQTTHVFRSEVMELTCHNLSLKEKEEQICTPIMKQVHIVTETKISSPNVVFSSRKYENTRYSTNYMDLTCLPESEDSSNVSSSFHEAVKDFPHFVPDELELTCNIESRSQYDTNISINNSAFRRVEQLSSCDGQTEKSLQWPLNFESSNNATNLKNDKNTQYFTSQPMELTCKTTDFQNDRLFAGIGDNNNVKESSQLLLHPEGLGDKTLSKLENKTQHFISHPMEMTCKTTNFQDENLFVETPKSDNFASGERQVPSYFHLKERSVLDSTDAKSPNRSADHSVRGRKKMFKVTTDNFSSSKPISSFSRPETAGNLISNNSISSGLPSNALDKNCQILVSSVLEKDPCWSVTATATNQALQKFSGEMVSKKAHVELEEKNAPIANSRALKNLPPSRTPGVVYKIRKIKQAFKEKGSNLVLYPELSEALRMKQKFNIKHPYSEMKLTSPEIKDKRQNRSFDPSSQENSFTCLSREGSLVPSVGRLSSHFQETSVDAKLPVMHTSPGIKSVCREIESLSVIVTSPEKHQGLTVSQVNRSVAFPKKYTDLNVSEANCAVASPEKHRGLNLSPPEKYLGLNMSKVNRSVASPEKYLSLNVSKINHSVSYNQMPSITYDDDSLELLRHSALENSFLEAASKNYTICLDRSDFVLKEKCLVPTDKNLQLLSPSANESAIACSNSMSQGNSLIQTASKSSDKSKENDKAAFVINKKSLGRKRSFASPQISKTVFTKQTQFEDLSLKQGKPSLAAEPCLRNSSMDISSFAARIKENDCLFPIASSVGNDTLQSSPLHKTRRLNSPERSKSLPVALLATTDRTGSVTSSTGDDVDTVKAFDDQEDADMVSVEEAFHNSNNVAESFDVHDDMKMVSEVERTAIASNVKESLIIQDDIGRVSAVENASIMHSAVDLFNIQDVQYPDKNEEMIANSQVSSTEKQNNCAPSSDISLAILNKLKKLDVKNSSVDPDLNLEHSFVKETPNDEIETVNEKVLINQVAKPQNSRKNYDGNLSDYRVPVMQNDFNYFEDKFNEAFAIEGNMWELKNLCEEEATFEFTWAVCVYVCVLKVNVKNINASESSISFTPIGENWGSRPANNVFGDIQDRGYMFFQHLVTDTILPFPVFSEKLIDKLAEYSKIGENVETLMRDLLKVSFAGECDNPYELDPLKVTIKGINTNYECIYNMTFCVDLKTYPQEKIVPEVKHVLCKDITKLVLIAADSVEPGPDYLFRMVDAARELKP